jgi:hypothetical protein
VVARGPPALRLRAAAHTQGVHLSALRRPGAAATRAGDGNHRHRPLHRGVVRTRGPDDVVARRAGRRAACVAPGRGARPRCTGGSCDGAGPGNARLGADRPGDRSPRARRSHRAAPRSPVGRRGDRPGDCDQGDTRTVPRLPGGHPAVACGRDRGHDVRRHRAGRLSGRPVGSILDPDAVADRPGGTSHRSEQPVPPRVARTSGRPRCAESYVMAGPRRPGTGRRDLSGGAAVPARGRSRRRHGHRVDRLPDQPDLLGAPLVLGGAGSRRAGRCRGRDTCPRRAGRGAFPCRPPSCRGRRPRRGRRIRLLADLVLRAGPGRPVDERRGERLRAADARAGVRPAGESLGGACR